MLDAGQDVKALPRPQSAACAALPRCVETRYPTARHALHLETDSVRDPWLKTIDQTLRARGASAPANP
jgi:lysophospholipase